MKGPIQTDSLNEALRWSGSPQLRVNRVPAEVQKRLFDPFFTTKEEGTGLGLSIAARIVEQQGGTLRYKTELNRGTTFAIVLPQAEHESDEPTT